jgi:uncharacterized protein (TIGR02246 family)
VRGKRSVLNTVAALIALAVITGCQMNRRGLRMDAREEEEKILRIIESYPLALEQGDAGLWESLFWLEDPDFSCIENDRSHVMGAEYIRDIGESLGQRGKAERNQRWYNNKVYFLAPDVAYSISLRDELNTKKASRVTLVYRKKDGQWRIIHCHFSFVPE